MEKHITFGIIGPEYKQAAADLVTRVYKKEGFIAEDCSSSAISEYLYLPSTTVFGAFYGDELIGTVSVVEDREQGLPMDSIFKDELDKKRALHLSIAEVCQFAINKDLVRTLAHEGTMTSSTQVSLQLLKYVFHFGVFRRLDLLAFTINPRHRLFYESLGCQQVGTLRSYPSVNNAPALAYVLDLCTIAKGGVKEGAWLIGEILRDVPDYRTFEVVRAKETL